MPWYFIKCGSLEVALKARDSETALERFRARYPAYTHLGTYLTRATRPEMGCAPRGANQAHEEPYRCVKTGAKEARVNSEKIEEASA